MAEFKKKIAIVTGASSGMGREFARRLDRDYDLEELWVIARREDRLAALSGECRAKVRPLVLDLSQVESLTFLEALLEEEQPDLRVLVNAAGYGLFGTFAQMGMEEQLGIVDLNDRALTAMCRLCIPYLGPGSAIINLGSNSSWQPVPYMNVYAASKAYVLSFSRGLGVELKDAVCRIICATLVVACTMSGPKILGNMCRTRILESEVPPALAASTYSRPDSPITDARAIRAKAGMRDMANATIRLTVLDPSAATMQIARRIVGMEEKISMTRMMILS